MAGRINTIMQTCFFALADVLPREQAIAKIKSAIEKTYAKRGSAIVDKNFEVVDSALLKTCTNWRFRMKFRELFTYRLQWQRVLQILCSG